MYEPPTTEPPEIFVDIDVKLSVVDPDIQLEDELAYKPFSVWVVGAWLGGVGDEELSAGRLTTELAEDDATDVAPGQLVPTADTVAVPDTYAAVTVNESPLVASTVYTPWLLISFTAARISAEFAQARSFAVA